MAFEQKDMTGTLFINERKQKDTHPDYTGKIKIDGRVWDLSAWEKQTKTGGTFLSISVKTEWVKPQGEQLPQGPKKYQVNADKQTRQQPNKDWEPLGDDDGVPF